MAIAKKKLLIYGAAVVGTSLASFFLFRKRKIDFYDNVYCSGEECCNVKPTSTGYDVVSCFSGADGERDAESEFQGEGYMNLVFIKPHGLKEGEAIAITQDDNKVFDYYDGKTTVKKVINKYIIRTAKAFKGSSNVVGGNVVVDSVFNRFMNS